MNWYKRAMLKTAAANFGWASIAVPGNISKKTLSFAQSIPEEEIYTKKENGKWKYGIEEDPHVTVKYGIHTIDEKKVEKALDGQKGGTVTLGKIDLFENDDYDVLKVTVISPTLRRLNKKLTDNLTCTDEYDQYSPHVTIAYLKIGEGKKYKGDDTFVGESFEINEIFFEDKNDKETKIKLA